MSRRRTAPRARRNPSPQSTALGTHLAAHEGLAAVEALRGLGMGSLRVAAAVGAGMPLQVRLEPLPQPRGAQPSTRVFVRALNYDQAAAAYGRGWTELYDWALQWRVALAWADGEPWFTFVVPAAPRQNPSAPAALLRVSEWPAQRLYAVLDPVGRREIARLDIRGDSLVNDQEITLDVETPRGWYQLTGYFDDADAITWWRARFNNRSIRTKTALERVGAVLDRLLEIHAQELLPLEGGEPYALAEWP